MYNTIQTWLQSIHENTSYKNGHYKRDIILVLHISVLLFHDLYAIIYDGLSNSFNCHFIALWGYLYVNDEIDFMIVFLWLLWSYILSFHLIICKFYPKNQIICISRKIYSKIMPLQNNAKIFVYWEPNVRFKSALL